ncbi:MAG: hypothetical protein Q8M08_02195 [Bacteroidales bacterium]|nr:hypothetical protein [Bacteroidales bacterium]
MRKWNIISGLLILLSIVHSGIVTGQVAINNDGSPADNSAMLDIKSNGRGMLVPRMTTAQRNSIPTPAPGLLVYDNTTASFWYFNSIAWLELTGSVNMGWSLSGNSGTIAGTNFLGTSDAQDLVFKVNGIESGRIGHTGYLNTGLGYGVLYGNTTGANNTAIGYGSLGGNY